MTDAETEASAPAPELAPEAAANPKLDAINAVIGRWMADRILNSPVSRSTEAINHLNAQLPWLAQALALEI